MRAAAVCCAPHRGATASTAITSAARATMFVVPGPAMAGPMIMAAARRPAMARASGAAVMEEIPIRMAARAFRPVMPLVRLRAVGGGVAVAAAVDAGGTDGGF